MNTIRNLIQQFKTQWDRSGAAQRAALAAAAAVLAAAVIGVGVWSSRPQYVMLAADLSPHAAAELAGRLDAKNIAYKMSFSGSALQVRKSDYNSARLAAGELVSPGGAAPEPIGVSIVDDPSLNGYRIERRLEESLARTIVQFEAVERATVHIGKPPASPFAMHQQEVTASVVLQMRPQASFGSRQAAAVVATVSQGVEGLLPENVTVSDTQGRILSNNATGGASYIAGQLEYRQRIESDLAANAQLLLSPLVGFGRAVVRVSADIDFNSRTSEETSYDPDAKVRSKEKIETTETRGLREAAAGVPGAGTNITGGPPAAAAGDALTKTENIDTTYETAKTVDKIHEAAGRIRRLTVAAVVDLGDLQADEKAADVTPQKLEGIIKQAVGFDESRQDQIELLLAPLAATAEPPAAPAAPPWQTYEPLIRAASLGMGALVALILGTMAIRKIQLVSPSTPPADATLDTRRTQALARMSDTLRRDPDQLKDALRVWLTGDDSNDTSARAA